MATYAELYALAGGSPEADALRQKVAVAIAVAAEAYLTDEAATAAQKSWAASVVPNTLAPRVYQLVLAANKAASVATIQGAADATIQSNVDAIVSNLADGSA